MSSSLDDVMHEVSSTPTVRQKEPQELLCPITHVMFRDPVMVPEAGRTYERAAILEFWRKSGRPVDPMSNRTLKRCEVFTNWDKRGEVQSFLDQHPDIIPEGWQDRTPPAAEVSEKMHPAPSSGTQSHASSPRIWGLLRCLTRILVSLVGIVLLGEAIVLLWAHRQLIPVKSASSSSGGSFEVWWTTVQPPHRILT